MENNSKKIIEEIEIPSGISAKVENREIIVSKNGKELKRKVGDMVDASVDSNKILLKTRKASKMEKKLIYSLKAHVKNMFEGLEKGFKYTLKIATVHFPMTAEVDKAKNMLIVKNFLGEKKPREITILAGVNVTVSKDTIEIESADIEKAGQTAANIEKGTKIKSRDRRVFQDGIFIVEKPGIKYL